MIHVNQQYDADGLDYLLGAIKSDVAPVVGTIHMPLTNAPSVTTAKTAVPRNEAPVMR